MDTTTEPVAVGGTISGAVQAVLLGTFALLQTFGVWSPTNDQIAAITGLYLAFVVLVQTAVTTWQRSKVTPVAANAVAGARQDGAMLAVKALAANDVPAAVAATTGVTIHDLRYPNGEPVVAPPPTAGMTPPPPVAPKR
jgi:hypothetical protein